MKYFLIAGEPSGDQHAARLMESLAKKDADSEFGFLGGDLMSVIGGKPVVHISEMAFMGFTQVLANLSQIRKNFKRAKRAILKFRPDIIIFVDYPGFNLRMAKWSKQQGLKSVFYISPTVWAWNSKRVYSLQKNCERVYCILPFEPAFYQKYDIEVDYVGNPVFEYVLEVKKSLPVNHPGENKRIALLPGSRKQEIERILPLMLSVIESFKEYQFLLAGMENHKELYADIIPDSSSLEIDYSGTLKVLNSCDAALVTSGTATLETALMGIPQVICYKTNAISYRIARSLIKVPYISLVNLILEGPAVPELIQGNCNPQYLLDCLKSILPGGANHEDQLELTARIQDILGYHKVSDKLAGLIVKRLSPLDQQEKIF